MLSLYSTCASMVATSPLPSSFSSLASPGGFAVVPNFLSEANVKLLKSDVSALKAEGRFAIAGVGDASTKRVSDDVRRCEQCFLYPRLKHGSGGDQSGRQMLYSVLDGLQSSLQAATGQSLDGLLTEGLYAAYPSGGYYRRHIDSYPGTPQEIRKFSYLLYCNEDWQPSDGGCLRIHTDGGGEEAPPGSAPSFVDIEPRAGTLVVFRSTMPHEVLDTDAQRLAVAGWFNKPVQGSSDRRQLITYLGGALVVGSAVKFALGALGGDGK